MAVVSISEAARLTGKSRKTIQRYVADGRLSVSQDVAGKPAIDTSELIRVFGEPMRRASEKLRKYAIYRSYCAVKRLNRAKTEHERLLAAGWAIAWGRAIGERQFQQTSDSSDPPASLWTSRDKSLTCPNLPTGDPHDVEPTA